MDLLQYYGVDWIGMVATFFSLYWLGDKSKWGFVIGGIAALCWATFGVLTASIPATVANIVFFFLNARGFLKWNKS